MSSGVAHARATAVLTPITAVTVAYYTESLFLASLAAAGCACGIILSPDLDLEQTTRSERVLLNKSPLLGKLFKIYWYPYGVFIPHRSAISHFPVVGTLSRVAYLLIIPALLAYQHDKVPQLIEWVMSDITLFLVLGLIVSDTAHTLMDILPKRKKKKKRKKPRRRKRK